MSSPLSVPRTPLFKNGKDCSNNLGFYRPHRLVQTKRRRLLSLTTDKLGKFIPRVQNSLTNVPTEDQVKDHEPMTGSTYYFKGATISLTDELKSPKKVTLVRHGLGSWNEESRIQGSSNLSVLTDVGAMQAEKCRNALTNINFDICYSSPISRAKSTAEIIWHGREKPLVFLHSLKEAHLFFLEGMTNDFGGSGS